MSDLLKLENIIFITQSSVIAVGWCLPKAGHQALLKVDGVLYSRISANQARPDVNDHFKVPQQDLTGFRRTILLPEAVLAKKKATFELVLEKDGTEVAADSFVLDIAKQSQLENLIIDYDDNTERLASRHCWPDNLEAGLTTVILGVYNGGHYLKAAIDSVLAQSDRNFQFIIIDDASTDNTRQTLLEYRKQDPRIELILKDHNAGQGHAFNSGIRAARGDLTCVMDADDFWFADKIKTVRASFEANKDSGLYALYQHGLNICYGDQLSHEPFRSCLIEGDVINHARKEKLRIPGPFVPTAGLSFPTEILRAVYPIPRAFRICADGYLTRAAISLGHAKAISTPLGAYRIHGANNTIDNENFKQERYIEDILIPQMNQFYRANGIYVQLPFTTRGRRSVALNRLNPMQTQKGTYFANTSQRYFQSLAEFKDIHKGRRAFIVATGPSLKVSDLDMLKDEITFACNKITLAFDETDWRPTYYSIIDSLVYETFDVDWSKLPTINFFPEDLRAKYGFLKDTYFVKNRRPIYDGDQRIFEFGEDLTQGAAGGYTVVYLMMQLAYFMGIEELYLIGLDFSFSFNNVSDEKTVKGEAVIVNEGEVNHFHKGYRPDGEKWTMPRLDLQEQAFAKAKETFEAAGRKIYNASRATKLELFERADFDTLMAEKQKDNDSRVLHGDIYGGIIQAQYISAFEELRVSGWVTPKPASVAVFHEDKFLFSGTYQQEGIENGSLASGEGIYVWSASGEAPIKTGDTIKVVLRFRDGSVQSLVYPVETQAAELDLKLAVKELLTRNRALQRQISSLNEEKTTKAK
ncbi:MAG: glycosyltransferase [Alphaproteobacteria bacterium]|nr:MAG: glycosyltransferase [Alphaproteobacteria bacterium]